MYSLQSDNRQEANTMDSMRRTDIMSIKKLKFGMHKKPTGLFMTLPAIIVMLVTVLYPIGWSLALSFSDSGSVFSGHFDFIGLDNYIQVIQSPAFQNAFGNTLKFVACTIVWEMVVGFLVALTINSQPPGHKVFNLLFTLPLMIGILDTKLGLIIIHVPLQLMLNIWMLYGSFKNFPKDLIDAGYIDGLGPFKTLAAIVVPITIPMIAVATVFSFLASWNEFFFAMLTTSSERAMTLPVYIAGNITSQRIYWGRMTAMGIAYAIPAILFTLVAQKGLIKGISAGAVKG